MSEKMIKQIVKATLAELTDSEEVKGRLYELIHDYKNDIKTINNVLLIRNERIIALEATVVAREQIIDSRDEEISINLQEIEILKEKIRKLNLYIFKINVQWDAHSKCKRLWKQLKKDYRDDTLIGIKIKPETVVFKMNKMEVMESKEPKIEDEEEGLICSYCMKIIQLPTPYQNGACFCPHCQEVLN